MMLSGNTIRLRSSYDVKTKVEPFYSGGKICALSPCQFVCKCGPAVKLILTPSTTVVKKDDENQENINESAEDEAETTAFAIHGHFETDMDEIISFDACPITFTLITAHKSQLLRKWDLNTKEVIQIIKSDHTTPIIHLEINKSRSILTNSRLRRDELVGVKETQEQQQKHLTWATVSGSIVRIWDDGGSTMSKKIKIDEVASIGYVKWDYSTNGLKNQLLVAERNIYIIEILENVGEYKITQTLEGHYSQVTGIEWAENGTMISGGRDKIIILWNLNDRTSVYEKLKTLVFPGVIESMNLLCGKELYIIGTSPNIIRHFDMDSNKLSASDVLAWTDDEPIAAAYSPVSHRDQLDEIYITTHAGSIYRVGRKKLPKILPLDKKGKRKTNLADSVLLNVNQQYVGSLDEILSIVLWEATSTDTKIVVANNTSIIKVYDMNFGNCQFLRGHKDIVLTLCAKDDWLVSGSKDNKIICWRSDSLEPEHILEGHLASVNSVFINPTKFEIYSVSEDNVLRAWNTTKCLRSKTAHDKEIQVVHCSPNGALVVTGSRDKTAKVWVTESFELMGVLKGHKKSIWDAKFSNWDQLIVTSSADSTLKIWNIPSLDCIKTLQGHQSSVLQGIFVNSGLQVLSASTDGTWKSWDIRTPICVSTSECSDDKVWALTSTLDGSLVVTGTADSIVTIWTDVTQEKADENLAKRKKTIEDEQMLSNVIRKCEWKEAIRLAIDLDRPFTLLKIIRGLTDICELSPVINELTDDHKTKLVQYIKQWNTNTRTSTEAQILLNIILSSCPPSQLHSLPTSSLLPYTEKHYQRLQKNEQFLVLLQHLANFSAIRP